MNTLPPLKRIAVISLSNLSRDPRVWRQIKYLVESGYSVTAAGFDDPHISGVEFIQMKYIENSKKTLEVKNSSSGGSVVFALPERFKKIVRTLIPSKKVREIFWPLYRIIIKSLKYSYKKVRTFNRKLKALYRKIHSIEINNRKQIALINKKNVMYLKGLRGRSAGLWNVIVGARRRPIKNIWQNIKFSFMESDYLLDKKVSQGIPALQQKEFDLIIANDFSALSVAFAVKGSAKLIYDAHEYTLGQYDTTEWREKRLPYIRYILDKYLPGVDGMMTVCEGIAKEYEKEYSVKTVVVTNAPEYWEELKPSSSQTGKIRLVHHGVAHKSRSIEEMIDTVGLLDERFSLDFYLVGKNDEYHRGLRERGAKVGRVIFHDPVPMKELPRVLNEYDVGFYILNPVSFNALHALPNKFFEFVQARLMIAIGPSPEMAVYVEKYGLGVVAEDFTPTAMAARLKVLDKNQIDIFKRNVDINARQLSAEPQMRKMNMLVNTCLNDRGKDE